MRKFETLLLFSPELSTENRENIVSSLIAIIEKENGSLIEKDSWGMRDLAYPVCKQMRGYYIRLEFIAPGDAVAELERIIRITEGIFKFITIKLADEVTEVIAEEVA